MVSAGGPEMTMRHTNDACVTTADSYATAHSYTQPQTDKTNKKEDVLSPPPPQAASSKQHRLNFPSSSPHLSRPHSMHQTRRLSSPVGSTASFFVVLVLALLQSTTAMFRKGCQRGTSAFVTPSSATNWMRRLTPGGASTTSASSSVGRRPSLGLLSAAFLVGSSRCGVGATNPTSGFCSSAANTHPLPPFAPTQTCLAAHPAGSGDGVSVAPAPTAESLKAVSSPTEKKKLQPKYRSSYRQPDYWIKHTELLFEIVADPDPEAAAGATVTYVTSTLTVERNVEGGPTPGIPNLELDGEELTLMEIKVNGQPLPWDGSAFVLTAESDLLVLGKTIEAASGGKGDFTLQTKVLIKPEANFELSGFYKSGSAYCTQCEAEGFRRITFYLDRPDVMARFKVRIEADKAKLPLLLSNGNKVGTGELPGGRHFAEWEDPFPKPSYLFAVVAGDLGSIVDTYKTTSGRDVRLEIFSEHDNVDKLEHAMMSLKKSMKWDEDVYGLEYDLDIYNIVAVNDFNMGAMENKGLNVFNTAFVLAKPETATDTDYERIEGVIAHEYFHNWSGNRVTCQDWFQLTLKEGLTVFRDQQFSADMGSAAVKRIEDVRVLRARQFAEDSGPRAHAIRPESYMKMDNFYTSTVYEKGAEVIRMYHTLLGTEGFRKGMDLYFERHDGSAVTCDDFRAAMSDANGGKDFRQFERWYLQAGTPVVEAKSLYDSAKKMYSLTLSQHTAGTVGQPSKLPFHIPVRVGLLGRDGKEVVPSQVLELKEASQTFHFEGIEGGEPVPSLLRGFSAPVRLKTQQTEEDLAFLMAHDTDSFNRWEASQKLASQAILAATEALTEGKTPEPLALTTIEAFRAVLKAGLDTDSVDKSLLAYALSLPEELTLLGEMDVMRPVDLHEGREHVKKTLAVALKAEFLQVYEALDQDVPYAVNPEEIGRRRLKNVCMSYLCTSKDKDAVTLASSAFKRATCMTDSIAALACLASLPGPEKDEALQIFYSNAKGDPLVLNKWFSIQAFADLPDTIDRIQALIKHPDFSMKNPNRFRALIGAFANSNLARFHAEDGRGYVLVADMVLAVDKLNPQVAARLAGAFSLWRKFENSRRNMMKEQLDRLMAVGDGLSRDTYEIVSQSLLSA